MQRIWDWLLNLEQVKAAGGGEWSLRLTAPWPMWAALLATAVVIAFTVLVYRRDGGSPMVCTIGGILRGVLLVLLLLLIWQPVIHVERLTRDKGVVVVLIDTSGSMATPDVYAPDDPLIRALLAGDAPTTQPDTPELARLAEQWSNTARLDMVQRMLSADDYAPLQAMLANNDLALYTFAQSPARQTVLPQLREQDRAEMDEEVLTKTLAARDTDLANLKLLQPNGLATSVGSAITGVLGELRGQRVAGVVVISDGRSTVESNVDAAIEMAHGFRNPVPIHTVTVGSIHPPRDLSVNRVVAEPVVFVKDLVAVKAIIGQHGYDKDERILVELIDQDDPGAPLASQTITVGEIDQKTGKPARETESELRFQPDDAGTMNLAVRVQPAGGDMNPRNNLSVTQVEVKDAKIRVLYVEGYPRWEYRYLKNSLKNEKTVTLSTFLFSADENFAQEGNRPITRLPLSVEEWQDYDVIIFGDVDPLDLRLDQMEAMEQFVRERGGGFALIAGERYAPQRYTNTPLARLLPVEIDPMAGPDRVNRVSGFKFQPTQDGQRSPILRFERAPEKNDETIAAFPELFWYKRVVGLRPGAIVLGQHPTAILPSGEPVPLLVTGRYGAGKTIFSSIDSTWRWRWHTGVAFFDAYWVNQIRWLSRNKLLAADRRFELSTDRTEPDLGQRVEVQLQVLDRSLENMPDELTVIVTDAIGLELPSMKVQRTGRESFIYSGHFIPPAEGDYAFTLDAQEVASLFGLLGGERSNSMPRTQINVKLASRENEQLSLDTETLERLSSQTQGRHITVADMGELAAEIPDMGRPVEDNLSLPLWDTKLALILFATILTIEWIWRKRNNLQ